MATSYTIEVTQEDIDKGVPGNPCSCMVARAVRRRFAKHKKSVQVFYGGVYVGNRTFDLPKVAIRKMYDFDERRPVTPFTFIMETDPWC